MLPLPGLLRCSAWRRRSAHCRRCAVMRRCRLYRRVSANSGGPRLRQRKERGARRQPKDQTDHTPHAVAPMAAQLRCSAPPAMPARATPRWAAGSGRSVLAPGVPVPLRAARRGPTPRRGIATRAAAPTTERKTETAGAKPKVRCSSDSARVPRLSVRRSRAPPPCASSSRSLWAAATCCCARTRSGRSRAFLTLFAPPHRPAGCGGASGPLDLRARLRALAGQRHLRRARLRGRPLRHRGAYRIRRVTLSLSWRAPLTWHRRRWPGSWAESAWQDCGPLCQQRALRSSRSGAPSLQIASSPDASADVRSGARTTWWASQPAWRRTSSWLRPSLAAMQLSATAFRLGCVSVPEMDIAACMCADASALFITLPQASRPMRPWHKALPSQ